MNKENLAPLSGSPGCFICDNNASNERSLKLKLLWDAAAGEVVIPCWPDASWCGFTGVVHGGLVATVLDEAMAWVVHEVTGGWAFTVDFQIRYKRPVQPGLAYKAIARVTENGRRKINAEAQFTDADGKIVASAMAIFLPSKEAVPQS